jgi:hypothetical protein
MNIARIILIKDRRHADCYRLIINGVECVICASRLSAINLLEQP